MQFSIHHENGGISVSNRWLEYILITLALLVANLANTKSSEKPLK